MFSIRYQLTQVLLACILLISLIHSYRIVGQPFQHSNIFNSYASSIISFYRMILKMKN